MRLHGPLATTPLVALTLLFACSSEAPSPAAPTAPIKATRAPVVDKGPGKTVDAVRVIWREAPVVDEGAEPTYRGETTLAVVEPELWKLGEALSGSKNFEKVEFFAYGFTGDPLVAPKLPKAGARVSTTIWPVLEGVRDAAGTRLDLKDYAKSWRTIRSASIKPKRIDVIGDRSAKIWLLWDLRGMDASGAQRQDEWVSETEWVKIESHKWQLKREKRLAGQTRLLSEPWLVDRTKAVGIQDDFPGVDYRDTANYTWGGVAAADYDGDGDVDLYVPRLGPNLLYRNDGTGKFENVAQAAGLDNAGDGRGAVFADFDDDGDQDLFLANVERHGQEGRSCHELYWNNGDGTFTRADPVAAGIHMLGAPHPVAVADYDNDGDLDIMVGHYYSLARLPEIRPNSWTRSTNGGRNVLLRNEANGTFKDVAKEAGLAENELWTMAVGFADYDGDGDQDLYVANDFGDNELYRNKGDGSFELASTGQASQDIGYGMGVLWMDYDVDGDLDLYISNMYSTAGNRVLRIKHDKIQPEVHRMLSKSARGNTLLRNGGDGSFDDVARETGTDEGLWAFAADSLDLQNDGHADIYVANGFLTGKYKKDL